MPTFIVPNSYGEHERGVTAHELRESTRELMEVWSAAARAAAAAARGHRGNIGVRKSVARAVYSAAGGRRNSPAAKRVEAKQRAKWEVQHQAWKKQQAASSKALQSKRAGEISSRIGQSKIKSPVEKVKVSGYGGERHVKITRRSAKTGAGKSRTYSKISTASKGRLARALGSGAKGFYFKGEHASQQSMMGRHGNRGQTKTGYYTYGKKPKKAA
jgi:hypothetical protein